MTGQDLRLVLAANVQNRRKELGLSQTELARLLSFTPQRISQLESAHNSLPVDQLAPLASCLRCTVAALVTEGSFSHASVSSDDDAGRIPDMDGMLTVQQAADVLGLSDSQVRRLCIDHNRGEKRGRDRFLSADDVEFLRNRPSQGRPKKLHAHV